MSVTIKVKPAEEFASALWNKITDTGFNTLSKNDIYDYLLYLFNKYGDIHFLDEKSNYENAVLLRVTETKIKNSKLNIALKYKTSEEKQNALPLFLQKLSQKPKGGGIWLSKDETHFGFVVEDLQVRMELENLLKTQTGTTLDYSFNSEKVSIEKVCFLELIKTLSGRQDGAFLEILNKQLNNDEFSNAIKTKSLTVAKALEGYLKAITVAILTNVIKATFHITG
jgi:hypothetical protein